MLKYRIFTVIWVLLGLTAASAKEKYAVLIGINDYQHPRIQDLNYSEADARYLSQILVRYGRYKSRNIRLLLGAEASFANIKNEIFWLGETAGQDDDVFFYFSGHGTRIEDTDGNEEDGMDEAFCPYETDLDKPATVILDDEIGHWFTRIKSKQVLVVLDCCHSGGAAGRSLENDGSRGVDMAAGKARSRGLINPDVNPYARDLTADNKFIITASDADEQSYENPKLGHGVFTYYLGEGIHGSADANHDREITALEMYHYTKSRTQEFASTLKRQQTPGKYGSLDDAVVVEIGKQLCALNMYDQDLKMVGLGAGRGVVQAGDRFIIRKTMQGITRDLEIEDRDIFLVEIGSVREGYSEGKIVEEYYEGISIDPSRYGDYYGEKISLGALQIITEPWATVLLDGKEIGPSPVIIRNVAEGDHTLLFRMNHPGYPGQVEKKISVRGNDAVKLVEKFKKK
ncbi:caspase family protein [bacterium]|nr:caspase family protein [bacterium]